MTKQSKILTGIIAGVTAIAGTLALLNTDTTIKHYPIGNFLRIDAHQWDLASHPQQAGKEKRTADLQNAIISTGITGVRLYSDASVIKDDNNQTFRFNPDGRGYEQDSAIINLKARIPGFDVLYCYQNAPKPIQTAYTALNTPTLENRNTQYRLPNTDPSNPATWSGLASDMAVIAARGGTNKTAPDYPVFVSPNWWDTKQQMWKGMGIYNTVEGGNEYDNGYSNNKFNPVTQQFAVDPNKPALNGSQYAVVWKTYYDAIKKIDPNISVSTTGVMTESPQILIDALAWAQSNNSGKPIFDKYQFHCYPWGWAHGNIASALPPEYNMIPAAKKVVAAAGDIPCIVGEWGYDLHPESNMGVRPFSNYSGEEIRSFWIMRSILGFAATGIESSYYYRIYQDYGLLNDNNPTIFETSSLFIKDDQDNITRRLSGDVFYSLSKYKDFVWDATIAEDSTKVVYRFKSGEKEFYVGWAIEGVQNVIVNGTNRAQFTERKLSYTLPTGKTIELSSKPVLIDGDAPAPTPTPEPIKDTIYTGRKGYWILEGHRVYYKVYELSDGSYQIKTGDYQWYKLP